MTTRAGYWIGGGLVLAAVVGAIAWAVLSFAQIVDTVDDFVRVPAPGSRAVQLEARKYIVYFEGEGAGAGAGADSTPPIEFSIADARSERALPAARYSGSLTYSFGGHAGTAQATVTPPRAGSYIVSARAQVAPSSGVGSGSGVALGESIGAKIASAIAGALLIGALLALAGIGLVVATAVRRRKRPGDPPAPAAPPAPAGIAGLES